jgi:hypothetical protein
MQTDSFFRSSNAEPMVPCIAGDGNHCFDDRHLGFVADSNVSTMYSVSNALVHGGGTRFHQPTDWFLLNHSCNSEQTFDKMFALTGSENFSAAIAAGSELRVIAVATVDLIGLGAELLVHQGDTALVAQEAGLMPVLVFVGQVLKQKRLTSMRRQLHVKMLRTQRNNPHQKWLGHYILVMLKIHEEL